MKMFLDQSELGFRVSDCAFEAVRGTAPLLLNHILRDKSGNARALLFFSSWCVDVSEFKWKFLQEEVKNSYYLACSANRSSSEEPYEIAFNMLNQDEVLSAGEIQNLMTQRAYSYSPSLMNVEGFLSCCLVQCADVRDALIARNNTLS